ncbi:hypothetical protein C8J47_3713 [Sphingomonas sp. PP-F2F-G114-C0414]|nr:hypothetical protein C8J47_3713 [Sphingomonas sp. PP-F2F-G114-C0414]
MLVLLDTAVGSGILHALIMVRFLRVRLSQAQTQVMLLI